MAGWYLSVVMLLVPSGSHPTAFLLLLGSENPSEREAANTAWVAIGGETLTAVRTAHDGQDSDVRGQAAALKRKTESELLASPTLVSLDFHDRPMSEVIRDVSAKTRCRLRILETQRTWLAERITLHTPEPVPFWKAVDRLCEAGRFQSNLGVDAGGACVALFRNETTGPTSDFGAFRVQIKEIHFNRRYRKLHLGRDQPSPHILQDKESSFIKLGVMVEPRMMIRNDGALKGLSVIDDRGQSLLLADTETGQRHSDFGLTTAAYDVRQVPLKQVGQPGRMIRKLQGVAPVVVAVRRPEPLVIPLEGAVGRSYRSDESLLTIRSVRKTKPNHRITIVPVNPEGEGENLDRNRHPTAIELTLQPSNPSDVWTSDREVSEHQFEVLDATGRVWTPLPRWLSDSRPRRTDREIRVLLTPVDRNLVPWPGDLAGAKLRYYDLTTARVDVPFEFTDFALP